MKRAWMILIFSAISWGLLAAGPPPEDRPEENISRLFVLNAYPGGNESHFSVLENQVKKGKPGGLFMHNGTPAQIASLVDRMNQLSGFPLLIGASLQACSYELPGHDIMERITDHDLLGEVGVLMGEKLKKGGIDFIIDPSLETFNERYDYGHLLARGYFTEGILPIYRLSDSENGPGDPGAVIVPYDHPLIIRRKIDYSGTASMKLRRNGFEGIIIVKITPDDLQKEDAVLHALKAGADLLLYPEDPSHAVREVRKWLRTGDITADEMAVKIRKTEEYRYSSDQPYRDQVRYVASPRDEYLRERLYAASVALVRNDKNLLPLRMLDTLEVGFVRQAGFHEVEKYLKKYAPLFVFEENTDPGIYQYFDLVIAPVNDREDLEMLRNVAGNTNIVWLIEGDIPGDISGFSSVILAPDGRSSIQRLLPQIIYGAHVPTGRYSGTLPDGFSSSIQFEKLDRLTYGVPESAEMDSEIIFRIGEIAEEAISQGATPGMQVLIARKGTVIYDKAFGYQSFDSLRRVTEETIYDLASVTKVLATLQSVMFMYEKGIIELDAPLKKYWPELEGTNKADIIIRDVLLHQAGLRPWLPFWRETMVKNTYSDDYYSVYPEDRFPLQVSSGLYASPAIRDSVWQWIIDSRLLRKKDDEPYGYRYSDMGFYIMQRLAEKELNQGLDEFVSQNLYDPLGMTTTGYLPLCRFEPEDIAPTADDPYFRKTQIDGLVHDEGAAMFGGVAGHSGLFSNSNDLAKLLQMLLWKGSYGGQQYFRSGTVELFSKKQVKDNRRGLGWDKPNVGSWRSPTSSFASAATFGHTGFTGTAVWVDPEYDLIYIFLSNRINPDVENTKLMDLNIRSRIQDLIYRSIWEVDQYKETLTQEP